MTWDDSADSDLDSFGDLLGSGPPSLRKKPASCLARGVSVRAFRGMASERRTLTPAISQGTPARKPLGSYSLSLRERAGVRVRRALPIWSSSLIRATGGPHPNPLPRGEGIGEGLRASLLGERESIQSPTCSGTRLVRVDEDSSALATPAALMRAFLTPLAALHIVITRCAGASTTCSHVRG